MHVCMYPYACLHVSLCKCPLLGNISVAKEPEPRKKKKATNKSAKKTKKNAKAKEQNNGEGKFWILMYFGICMSLVCLTLTRCYPDDGMLICSPARRRQAVDICFCSPGCVWPCCLKNDMMMCPYAFCIYPYTYSHISLCKFACLPMHFAYILTHIFIYPYAWLHASLCWCPLLASGSVVKNPEPKTKKKTRNMKKNATDNGEGKFCILMYVCICPYSFLYYAQ